MAGESKNGGGRDWLAPTISAGAQVGNTLLGQIFAERNRERNFYWNEKAADNADKRRRKFYADIESPKAQVQQLLEAGLSPSLMYGDMGGSSGNAAPQGAGIAGPYPSGSMIDPLAMAQIANINADTKVKEKEAGNIEQDTVSKEIENYISSTNIPQSIETATQEVELLKAEIAKLTGETKGIDWKNNFNLITQDEQVQTLINKNAELMAQVAELEARKHLHNSEVTLNEQERKNLIQQCKNMQEEITQRYIELDIYAEDQAAREAFFEENAYQGMLKINLDRDIFNFEKGEKWEFEKFKVGKEIQQGWVRLGFDFGASVLNSVANAVGARAKNQTLIQTTQMEIDSRTRPQTTHKQNYRIGKDGKKYITNGSYTKKE